MLVSLCLKSFKLGFSSKWTKDKHSLENVEEPEIKLPTSVGSQKKQGNSRKTSTSASLTMWKPLTVWKLWKILQEIGIPDHLACIMRNLYADQEAMELDWNPCHGIVDWFKIGKGVNQGCMLSPCIFKLYAEYIMGNVRLEDSQAGIKISRRNINNLRYALLVASFGLSWWLRW